MLSANIKEILQGLAPSVVIENDEFTPLVQDKLRIDETNRQEIAQQDELYVNGYQSDNSMNEEDMDNNKSYTNREKLFTTYAHGIKRLEMSEELINVSNMAYWRATSFKASNPIINVINDDPNSFWQSDGAQPHEVEVYFSKRVNIAIIAMYFSLKVDESYTPKLIKIYVGHSLSDCELYKIVELEKLNGWFALTFNDNRPQDGLMKCQFIKFTFPLNHENGKDTHLRGIRLFAKTERSDRNTTEWTQIIDPSSKLDSNYFTLR